MIVAFTPSAPQSAANKPVMSGPKGRKKSLPVETVAPSASTTSKLIAASTMVPPDAPQKTPFWLMPPPTVALMPDNVPHASVRNPLGLSARCNWSQLQPDWTVTVMSSSLISRMRFIAPVSISSASVVEAR